MCCGVVPQHPPTKRRARLHKLPREARHVLRRSQIDAAALDDLRRPGVGHRRQRQPGHRAHPLDHRQHDRRARAAVAAHRIRAPVRELPRSVLGSRPVEAVAILVHRHHHDHLQPAAFGLRRSQRLLRLVHRHHRLDHEQVGSDARPTLRQRLHLLARTRAYASPGETLPSAPTRTPSGPIAPATNASAACFSRIASDTLPRQPNAGEVELPDSSFKAVPLQPDGVRAERIRLDDCRAGLQILRVHRAHQLRLRDVQLVVAAVDEDAAAVQHGAHRPIAKHRSATKQLRCGVFCKLLRRLHRCSPLVDFAHLSILSYRSASSNPASERGPRASYPYAVWYTRRSRRPRTIRRRARVWSRSR